MRLFGAALLLTYFCAGAWAASSTVEARILWEQTGALNGVAPLDMDGDTVDELLIVANYYAIVRDQRLEVVSPSVAFDRKVLRNLAPGASGSQHLWVTYGRNDTAFLYKLWNGPELPLASGPRNPTSGYWDGAVVGVQLCCLDSNKRVVGVGLSRVGFARHPRGVIAWDWESGKQLWRYSMGPYPETLLLRDVDHDGRTEVLCGSVACRNSNSDNGTDDSLAYVFCLNSDGALRWRSLVGRYPQGVTVSCLHPDDSTDQRLLICEMGHPLATGFGPDSVFILDGRTGQVLDRAQFGRLNERCVVVQDERGHTRIVIASDDDTLRVLDERLRLLRKRALNGNGCKAVCVGRFTGRRTDEIAVASANGQLLLFDPDLRLLHRREESGLDALLAIRDKERSRLLVTLKTPNGEAWRLTEYRVVPVMAHPITVAALIAITLVLLAAFAGAVTHIRYRQTRDMRAVVRGLTGQAGVAEVDNRGHVRHTNPKARELLGGETLPTGPLAQAVKVALAEPPGSVPNELPVALDSGKTVLARAARVRSGVMLTLEDISAVEYLQRVKAWAPVAQKLAHGIKNPLGTIMGAVEQIEAKVGDDRVKKYVGYVKDEVTRLKKMTDAFMRFTKLNPPELQPRDINELVRKVVAKYEGALAKGISLELSLDERLPLVALDEEGIGNVLDIVLENAVEAMTANPRSTTKTQSHQGPEGADAARVLRIRTSVSDSVGFSASLHVPGTRSDSSTESVMSRPGSHVRVEVADSGVGIPDKYLSKVFEPYFTHGKLAGTGLGLALAKKIVEDHNGRVEIQSKEGTGTTVTIILPVERSANA
jgi:signal transduction histidine kinase